MAIMGRRLVWRLSADLVELPERENAAQLFSCSAAHLLSCSAAQLLHADDDNHQDSIEAAFIA